MPKKYIILFLILIIVATPTFVIYEVFYSTKNMQINKGEIFNVDRYTASGKMYINSNKNSNEYDITQNVDVNNKKYRMSTGIMDIIYKENKLYIYSASEKNKYEIGNYEFSLTNLTFLDSFILNYKSNPLKSTSVKLNDKTILNTEIKNHKQYAAYQTLEINDITGKPIKLTVLDKNKKVYMDIIYSEFIINPEFSEKTFDF